MRILPKTDLKRWSLVVLILLTLGGAGWRVRRPIKKGIRARFAKGHNLSTIWEESWADARRLAESGFVGCELLRKTFSRLLYWNFGASTSQEVKQGSDGWLFLTSKEARRGMHHTHAFSESELRQWADALQNWQEKLECYQSHLIFMVAPDKHSIYDEFAPVQTHTESENRLDQLYAYLRSHTSVKLVDVRPMLRREKQNHQLYYKTDTHWNDYGGYFAFVELGEALRQFFPHLKLSDLHDFVEGKDVPRGFDLARLAGVEDVVTEVGPTVWPRVASNTIFEDSGRGSPRDSSIHTPRVDSLNSSGTIPRLLMLRDSFAAAMLPYLAAETQRGSYLLTSQLDAALLEELKPSVVILEIVERHLYYVTPPKIL